MRGPMIDDPSLVALALALTIDLFLGEYPNRVHPVVWLGRLAHATAAAMPRRGPTSELGTGALMVAVVSGAAVATSYGVDALRGQPLIHLLAVAFLLKSSFSLRGLGEAASAMRDALTAGRLDDARARLSWLCSRDARTLDEPALVAATIESVAENASDSFVAPLLYYALFGLPGAVAYRAVNTLDAMFGYRGQYEYFGKASARLDDLLNLVPARLTAACLLLAGAIAGADVRRGRAVWRRDAAKTASPNAGHPMAAMAGLLGLALDKPGHYCLGDRLRPADVGAIDQAWLVVALAAGLATFAVEVALGLAHGL
jgi:adenosylcobinamide-phosphate synthase